jgi:hypothetical protein
LLRIPCKFGRVGAHSPDELSAYCDRPRRFDRLLSVDGVGTSQRGDRELTIIFPPDQLGQIADILNAKRRPVLSDRERSRRAELARSLGTQKTALPAAPLRSAVIA